MAGRRTAKTAVHERSTWDGGMGIPPRKCHRAKERPEASMPWRGSARIRWNCIRMDGLPVRRVGLKVGTRPGIVVEGQGCTLNPQAIRSDRLLVAHPNIRMDGSSHRTGLQAGWSSTLRMQDLPTYTSQSTDREPEVYWVQEGPLHDRSLVWSRFTTPLAFDLSSCEFELVRIQSQGVGWVQRQALLPTPPRIERTGRRAGSSDERRRWRRRRFDPWVRCACVTHLETRWRRSWPT